MRKNNWKYLILALAAVLITMLGPGLVVAQHGQSGHEVKQPVSFELISEMLDLSDTQKAALKSPVNDALAALRELHRLHGVIVAELEPEQVEKLRSTVHDSLGASLAGHGGHGQP